ncbi:MAG: 23S rRNA (adenine(2030)-N(6))-methyltransferase RlmJ [Oceanospirillaceae bacterium]|uniref:23S rRNA (adenine(2030)-N(6))-methyltransferase RlmJ n=1 Tax=unclassified Thalassolituus TaxID=2624967 RepID=UPI000C373B47|nr:MULTISPECIES: 23S rRNA (adenine(2030)-N(6))-methyltransferase RlmJ [unclassified Thalassolituus]MAY00022.1 23S rRNA (adenine(2030)-N(6))-methyltransferase RlmJ [Oceanospirillaceae bacterium]MBS51534.1 23S rRNA (adenine(2030)-N(6))-methyltransferase RlmJ [Oceanospirillaceae bacterium]|tara:strand:- start:1116 stop:1967 length:852 start_codon:yes stop_codon:yes gene_type:complete
MLSYRHAFHAGNFADVLKHLVQVEILNYLKQKDKPFAYIDTHAGAGIYSLSSEEAGKNEEFRTGISILKGKPLAGTEDYLEVVAGCKPEWDKSAVPAAGLYPGSPRIAQQMLRAQDSAHLFELHPQDFRRLDAMVARDRRMHAHNSDGFSGLLGLLPVAERRALVLIDPPYEVKSDYDTLVETVKKAHRKFATGVYALWYPVVDRQRIDKMEKALINSGIPRIQLFELGVGEDTEGRGMTSSGMIVINPPFTLMGNMQKLLPQLTQRLAGDNGVWRCEELVGE